MEEHPLKRPIRVPGLSQLEASVGNLSFLEKLVVGVLSLTAIVSGIMLLGVLTRSIMEEVPAHGGALVEGVVGAPRFINPILAISDADRDLTQVVYSGLMRALPDGTIVPDLAEEYEISDGGRVYTFTIREDAVFHDNTPVTADDVLFTIQKAQDSGIKSPKRANWEGVLVEKVDEHRVRFTLAQPYALFLENTILGVLPAHIWKNIDTDQFAFSTHNIEPVGSGPYRVVKLARNDAGVPERYDLKAFSEYEAGEPFITNLSFIFFANEEELFTAYSRGAIDAMNAINPETATRAEELGARIETYPLPRVFGVFFNHNQVPIFTSTAVREALSLAIDREGLVGEVLKGYGTPATGPLPPKLVAGIDEEQMEKDDDTLAAIALLEANGWVKNEETGIFEKKGKSDTQILHFSLATSNAPELKAAAEYIAKEWRELGADVELRFFDTGSLNQEVIRPRKYDALFFGQILGRQPDPFAFWHSSQRNDPGLNIALYTNIEVDAILERIRTLEDEDERAEAYSAFEDTVRDDIPALFVYTPNFLYVVPKNIRGLEIGTVTTPAERFLSVHQWHIETQFVWPFLAQ